MGEGGDAVKRDFSAATVDEKWCGDLTELPTEEVKLYLSSVLDLASRRVAGFCTASTTTAASPVLRWSWPPQCAVGT